MKHEVWQDEQRIIPVAPVDRLENTHANIDMLNIVRAGGDAAAL
jgi:hypothetical protein